MKYKVVLSRQAEKDLKYVPKHILRLFDLWVETIETEGFMAFQLNRGYRGHGLRGKRYHQRPCSLTRSWRTIYILDGSINLTIIEVLEVNHHDY